MNQIMNNIASRLNGLLDKPISLALATLVAVLVGYCVQTSFFFDTYRTHATGPHLSAPEDPLFLQGQAIYRSEGCQYCHTQNQRPMAWEAQRFSDVKKYGYYQTPEAIEFRFTSPSLSGSWRIGPDLSRLASRYSASRLEYLLKGKSGTPLARAMHSYGRLFDANDVYDEVDALSLSWKIRAMMNAGVPFSDSYQKSALDNLPGRSKGDALKAYLLTLGARQSEFAGKYYK